MFMGMQEIQITFHNQMQVELWKHTEAKSEKGTHTHTQELICVNLYCQVKI